VLLDRATGLGTDLVVSITEGRVVHQVSIDAATEGQGPILDEEFEDIELFLLESPEWLDAMGKRGIDPGNVRPAPLSAGVFGHQDEVGRRIVRVLAFHQQDRADLPWAHPIDGVVAYVDLTQRRVVKVIDDIVLPIPAERGQWDAAPHTVPARTDLKPIEITQPEGPSFRVEGNQITWADWTFRFGFDIREGLTLHQLSIRDGDVDRPVIYRASIAEMVVPYADPSPIRYWQNYFDQGEYLCGRYTNSLELGCDCLGEITCFDVTIADENGEPTVLQNAICLHEGTTACCGSTPTCSTAWPRPAAPGDWSSRSSSPSETTTTGSTRTSISTAPSSSRQRRPESYSHPPTVAQTGSPPKWRQGSVPRFTSICFPRGWTWRSTATSTRSRRSTRCGRR